MCSIYGYFGNDYPDIKILNSIQEKAKDRGRDGGRCENYELHDGDKIAILGNWRAAPTTEIEVGLLQPYDGLVHNGIISNDKELGGKDDEIDSQVLARVLDRTSLETLLESLNKVKGSYAFACHNGKTVFLGCNYKPVHYWSPDGGSSIYFSSMSRHFKDILPFGQAPTQLTPYSILDLSSNRQLEIPRQDSKKVLVICSSGLDSTTCAYLLKSQGWEVGLLHFVYGCHATGNEVDRIKKISEHLGSPVYFYSLNYNQMIGDCPILSNGGGIAPSIKGAEYAYEWVPARNLVFLSIAIAYAEANGYHAVALGSNEEESGAFPDNEQQMFINLGSSCANFVQNGYRMDVLTPVGNLMKHEIVKTGLEVGVPFELTWSCYKNEDKHCGNCGPCFLRKTAFERNGVRDPVFWD